MVLSVHLKCLIFAHPLSTWGLQDLISILVKLQNDQIQSLLAISEHWMLIVTRLPQLHFWPIYEPSKIRSTTEVYTMNTCSVCCKILITPLHGYETSWPDMRQRREHTESNSIRSLQNPAQNKLWIS